MLNMQATSTSAFVATCKTCGKPVTYVGTSAGWPTKNYPCRHEPSVVLKPNTEMRGA